MKQLQGFQNGVVRQPGLKSDVRGRLGEKAAIVEIPDQLLQGFEHRGREIIKHEDVASAMSNVQKKEIFIRPAEKPKPKRRTPPAKKKKKRR